MSADVKPWPEELPRSVDCTKLDLMGALAQCSDIVGYERARADAAMERLRLAVEALGRIARRDGIDGYPDDAWCVAAKEALEAIGEVPNE
jgi:hypothetical protein